MLEVIGATVGILSGLIAALVFFSGKENIVDLYRRYFKVPVIVGHYNKDRAEFLVIEKLIKHGNAKSFSFEEDAELHHAIYDHYFIKYENGQSYIVAAYTKPNNDYNCHACAPNLSFIEFKKIESGWEFGSLSIGVLIDGSWGKPPNEIKIYPIGKNNFGVFVDHKYNNQGTYVTYTKILVDIAGEFREVFSDQTSCLAVDGLRPRPNWEAEIKVLSDSTANFYDILVKKNGYSIPLNEESVLYKFDGRCYKKSDFYK